MDLPVEQVISALGLESHPTCGFAAVSYRSSLTIPRAAWSISSNADRALASALYFLVKADTRTAMHRIRSDQVYHHYSGDPLEVILLHTNGEGEVRVMAADLANGMRPQLLVPGGTFTCPGSKHHSVPVMR
jgi:predicted cupin superfamily sugar epimerase